MLTVGCAVSKPKLMTVNVSVENTSSNALDQVTLNWKGPEVPVGILSPGASAIMVGVEWPELPHAKLTFVDRKSRKPYSAEVSFEAVNQKIRSGHCSDVKIRILNYATAEATCE
jgi:hypothetical protein